MSLLPALADDALGPRARAVFDDIRATRGTDYVNDFWRVLANDPPTLARTWAAVKEVMAPGARTTQSRIPTPRFISVTATSNSTRAASQMIR